MGFNVSASGKVYYDGYDLSGDHNEIRLRVSVEPRPLKPGGSPGIVRLAGLKDFELSHVGYFNPSAGQVEPVAWDKLAVSGLAATICPLTGAHGERCFFGSGIDMSYEQGAPVGDVMTITGAMKASGIECIGGSVLKAKAAVTETGTGTVLQMGAVASGKKVWAAVHCFATTGSGDRSCIIKLQSDSTSNFDSPTDQITFAEFSTTAGAKFATPVAGPITDTWWRLVWTVVGTGKSFTIFGAAGIL